MIKKNFLVIIALLVGFGIYTLAQRNPPALERVLDTLFPANQEARSDSYDPLEGGSEASGGSESKSFLARRLDEVLAGHGISERWIVDTGEGRGIRVPREQNMLSLLADIFQTVEEQGGKIRKSVEDPATGQVDLEIESEGKVVARYRIMPDTDLKVQGGRIGLIIDDFGYQGNGVADEVLGLDIPLAAAVIPGLPYSQMVARKAHERGKEVLVHLPMEPGEGQVEDNEYTIWLRLSNEGVRKRVSDAYQAVPYAIGINNHMGSRATSDARIMYLLAQELRRLDGIFVDSMTSPKSVGFSTMRKNGVPTALNTRFLDHDDNSESAVANQLRAVALEASRESYAICIGHVRPATISVLKREIPILRRQGFRFVAISELVH